MILLPTGGAYEGYDGSTGKGLSAEHAVASASAYRASALEGSAAYAAARVAGLQDALFGSHVGVARRHVPLGGPVDVAVDVQSVMYEAGRAGATPSVLLRFYPPWPGETPAPALETVLFDGALLDASFLSEIDPSGDGVPDRTDVGRFNVSAELPAGWLYGPYLVEVEVSWLEEASRTTGATTVTEALLRTARVHDYFVATPADGVLPPSPIYDVHLVTWMDDWG